MTLWGVHGSTPKSGKDTSRFGGATSCYEIGANGQVIICDAGTGIIPLGQKLVAKGPLEIVLLFTHFHMDHVIGLPFFAPLYDARFTIRILAAEDVLDHRAKAMVEGLFSQPYFPVGLESVKARLTFERLEEARTVDLGSGAWVRCLALDHPGGNAALKVELGGKTVIYTGDFVHGDKRLDATLQDWLTGADLGILECTFSPEDFDQSRHFGHTHWRAAGDLARGASAWVGVHHHHLSSDLILSQIEADLRATFPNGRLGRDGMTFRL